MSNLPVSLVLADSLNMFSTTGGLVKEHISYPCRLHDDSATVYTNTLSYVFEIPEEFLWRYIKVKYTINVTTQGDTYTDQYSRILVDIQPVRSTVENILYQPNRNTDWAAVPSQMRQTYSQLVAQRYGWTTSQTNKTIEYTTYFFGAGAANYLGMTISQTDRRNSFAWVNSVPSVEIVEVSEQVSVYPEPLYPIDVNVNREKNNIFSWQIHQTSSSLSFPDVLKHTIMYKKEGTSEVQEETVSDSNNYQTIVANTFQENGVYLYKILVYTYLDLYIESDWIEFNAIGTDAAPTILAVSNKSIPTVSWDDLNQDAFIVRVKNAAQEIIFDSGIIAGTDQSYEIPQMFENGSYIVEVKELNIYGYFSEWGSAEFTLDPIEDYAPSEIFAFANNKYGVVIKGTPASDAIKTFVVRREKGSTEAEIIGEYLNSPFVDYSTKGNLFYEYTLRNYNEGYKDGEWIPIQTKIKEIVIQDGRDLSNFIEVSTSENSNFSPEWSEEVERTLFNCLGRKYPVKETGEWVNSQRVFTAYISEEKWAQLHEMALNAPKVFYKAKGEYFACDMSISDGGKYVGGGCFVKFTLTRIDDKGVNVL